MLQDRRGQYCQRQPQELLVRSEEVLFALYAGLLVTSFSPYLLFYWQLLSWSGSYGKALTTWLGGVRCYRVGGGCHNFSITRIGVIIGEIARPRKCVCFGCFSGSKCKTGTLVAVSVINCVRELDSATRAVGSDYKGGRVGYLDVGSTGIGGNR